MGFSLKAVDPSLTAIRHEIISYCEDVAYNNAIEDLRYDELLSKLNYLNQYVSCLQKDVQGKQLRASFPLPRDFDAELFGTYSELRQISQLVQKILEIRPTPYLFLKDAAIQRNLQTIEELRLLSSAKCLDKETRSQKNTPTRRNTRHCKPQQESGLIENNKESNKVTLLKERFALKPIMGVTSNNKLPRKRHSENLSLAGQKLKLLINCLHANDGNLSEEGIFRISGSKNEVDAICAGLPELLAKGKKSALPADLNPHNIATAIKITLQELNLPAVFLEGLLDTGIEEKEKYIKIEQLVHSLSVEDRSALDLLLDFLIKIEERSAVNLMTAANLALVFAPRLYGNQILDPQDLLDSSCRTRQAFMDLFLFYKQNSNLMA